MNNLFNQTSLSSSQVQEYLSFLSHNLRQSPLAKEHFQNLFALQNFHSPMFLSPYISQRQGKTLQLTEDMSTPDSAFSSKEDAFQSSLLNSQAKALKFEEDALSFENLIKKEDGSELSYSSDSKTQIEEMVKYFIQEFDNNDQYKSEYQRRRYASNAPLLKLFDSLREKYSSASKCREDMLRLALRKALTFLRDSLRKQLNISAKAASSELCKKYSVGRLTTCSNEEEIMDQLLPYKKNSKYSTPNLCFIQEIFASEAFAEDYVKYLSKIDQILEADNDKKIPKFVDFLVGCVEKNTLNKVKTFKRLPWLKTWLKATKIIAVELLETNTGISYQDSQSAKGRESEPKVRPRQFF